MVRRAMLLAFIAGLLSPQMALAQAGTSAYEAALGNSIVTGLGVKSSQRYTSVYLGYVKADTGIAYYQQNRAHNGWASDSVLNDLMTNGTTIQAVQRASLVNMTVAGGANAGPGQRPGDLYLAGTCGGDDNQDCLRADLAAFESNFAAILDRIVALRAGQPVRIIPTTVWNLTNLYDPAAFDVMLAYANQQAEATISIAAARGITVVDLRPVFNGAGPDYAGDPTPYMQADGLHPTATGHRMIADAIRAIGY